MKTLLTLLALGVSVLAADTLDIATPIKKFNDYKYESAHKFPMRIPTESKVIVVAFEKDTGALVNDYLNGQDPRYMPEYNAVFLSDIHRMPSIITSMFALPKMQKYKHAVYLHYGEEFENFVPHQEDKLTIIRFKNEKVDSISYISTVEELKAAIEQ